MPSSRVSTCRRTRTTRHVVRVQALMENKAKGHWADAAVARPKRKQGHDNRRVMKEAGRRMLRWRGTVKVLYGTATGGLGRVNPLIVQTKPHVLVYVNENTRSPKCKDAAAQSGIE